MLVFALGALAVLAFVPGALALSAPRTFYDDFPLIGSWVDNLPPYNEHLTTDVGGFYLGFALLFAWAARRPHPALVQPLCVAWLLPAVAHFAFHVTHLDGFGAADAVGQTATLAAVVALPAFALALSRS